MSVPRTDADIEFADYGAIIRRRWYLVVLGVVIGVGAAVAAIAMIPKTYTSTAAVMVQPTGEDGSVQNGRTTTPINLDTEAQIVKSTVVSQKVIEAMDDPVETEPRELAKHVMVTVPPNTSVLNIAFSASTPQAAQAGAEQYATSYLENRKAVAEGRLDAEARSVEAQIATLQTRLRNQARRISRLPLDSPDREYETSQRDLIVDQISSLSSDLVKLTSTEVLPGEVITEAQKPTTPSDPNIKILGASGLLAGLLLGLLLAVLVDRADKRIRDRRDLERLGLDTLVARVDVPSAVDVVGVGISARGVESLRQLRNALLARFAHGRGVVMVAGMSEGSAGSDVAVNLAATLARSGVNAVLVSANTVRCGVSEAFESHHRRGLADILRHHATVSDVVFDVPGLPGLRAMTAGSDGSLYSELLQSSHVKAVFDELAADAEVLVVDVAPTTVNADAQSLASMGTGVLLVAAEMRTKRAEVVDAIDQLRHVSATLLGSVVARVQPPRTTDHGETEDDAAPHGGAHAAGSAPATVAGDAASARDVRGGSGDAGPSAVVESTLVDIPALTDQDLPDEGADDSAEHAVDEDDDLDDDEQRPVYIRSGAPHPSWRDD